MKELQQKRNLFFFCLTPALFPSTWGLSVATSLEILDLSSNKIKIVEGIFELF